MKKILLTAAAAVALSAGASTLSATDANAGFHFKFHHKKHHHFKKHHHGHYCKTKYKKVKVGYWTKWGYVYKYVYKPIRICH